MKVLYHGTTPEAAEAILKEGWTPDRTPAGANMGQTCYLYLTTGYEDALWFAEQKGSDVVLEVRDIPLDSLAVDPEDGMAETVEEEVSNPWGLPGKLVLTKPLGPEHFSLAPRPFSGPRR